MIYARFDQINSLYSKDKDHLILRGTIHQAPNVGQVVNLKGDPFVVHDIGWAFDDMNDGTLMQYCYIRCLPRPAEQK